ncbi:MAG: hypothetical protein G01um101431_687 [Parcubacteria group bacterium Gr01-1014_31]|nr:MAG: hypothetical protein G01um101431_687 [Parcubacteria group bacterium Gr01-1014_31]
MRPTTKRRAVVISLVAGLSVGTFALASHLSVEAEKFFQKTCTRLDIKGINAFVCDLRERLDALTVRVDNIPAGPQGEPGPAGSPGPQGPAGAGLVVKDVNDVVIGPLVQIENNQLLIWKPSIQRVIELNPVLEETTVLHSFGVVLSYESNDCTGNPVWGEGAILRADYDVANPPSQEGWTKMHATDIVVQVIVNSEWNNVSRTCTAVPGKILGTAGLMVEGPFGGVPYTGPLKIVEE